MTHHDLATLAVAALVEHLPTTTTLKPVMRKKPADDKAMTTAFVASFVGSPSSDFALALIDETALPTSPVKGTSLSTTDVLQPALDAAGAATGAGVLGDVEVDDATALFTDANSIVFDLVDGKKVTGWFAVRVRAAVAAAEAASTPVAGDKLARLNNVEMALTVEIGRTRMAVRDVLGLEPGAIVELDRSAGAPADILLNGRLIAFGEVVVVDQDYAVRVTQILDAHEGAA